MKRLLVLFLLVTVGTVVADGARYDVILARDDIPVDWIIAETYSHKVGVPIITTPPGILDDPAWTQLEGYREAGWRRVLIIGGENAISPETEQELNSMGMLTHRISEADRYGTSARVAIELYGGAKGCVVVGGEDYKSLLIGEKVAIDFGYPLLLVKENEVPESVHDALDTLRPEKVFLVKPGITENVSKDLEGRYKVVVLTGIDDHHPPVDVPDEYFYLGFGILFGLFLALGFYFSRRSLRKVSYSILTEDEEKVIKAIMASEGEIEQDRLPAETGFSRPKVSRIVSELKERDIVFKEPYKRTNRIKLKKEFYEESRKG